MGRLEDSTICFIGLDVSSTDGWAAIGSAKPRRFLLSQKGAQELLAWAGKQQPDAAFRVVMEHTGVYSLAWKKHLNDLGVECALCNPARIRQFAQGMGFRSKTDKADAAAILLYAQLNKPVPSRDIPQIQRDLGLLLRQRRRISKQVVVLKNQLHALKQVPDSQTLLEPSLRELMQTLAACQRKLESRIREIIAADSDLREAYALLRSIPGIGKVNAALLCSQLDTIRDCKPKQLTALAGLAPSHKQSGNTRGKSHIDRQGRPELRRCLYMAGLRAARDCPPLIKVKQRLLANGKPGKLMQVAVARHLLLLAQDVVIRRTPFYLEKPAA
jgi:transposase